MNSQWNNQEKLYLVGIDAYVSQPLIYQIRNIAYDFQPIRKFKNKLIMGKNIVFFTVLTHYDLLL